MVRFRPLRLPGRFVDLEWHSGCLEPPTFCECRVASLCARPSLVLTVFLEHIELEPVHCSLLRLDFARLEVASRAFPEAQGPSKPGFQRAKATLQCRSHQSSCQAGRGGVVMVGGLGSRVCQPVRV